MTEFRMLAMIVVALTGVSCERGERHVAEWGGVVDTIGGRIVTSNPSAGIWRDGDQWRIEPDLRIGAIDGTGPEVFGSVAALSVANDGTIAVLDGHALELRLFTPTGGHLRTIGRRGSGPGEFAGPTGVHFDSKGRLWVPDASNARYNVFDSNGHIIQSARRVAGIVRGAVGALTDDDHLIDVIPIADSDGVSVAAMLVSPDLGRIDTLPALRTTTLPSTPVPAALAPFMSRTVYAFDRSANLWFAPTDSFRLYQRSPGGDILRVITTRHPQRRFSQQEEDSIAAVIRNWPHPVDRAALRIAPQVIRAIHVSDSRHLFVEIHGEAPNEGSSFHVFDPDGRYLGTIRSPMLFQSRPAPVFYRDFVYGVVTDELSVPYVVRARIVR